MRPIDADALKDKLQQHHDFWVMAWGGFSKMPISDKKRVDEITNCIAEVVNAPTIDALSEWIPCSERLPSEFSDDERVLATTDVDVDGLGVILIPAYDVKSWYLKRYISAWMPLPKPYEEVKENE